jgi:hypothetical protein
MALDITGAALAAKRKTAVQLIAVPASGNLADAILYCDAVRVADSKAIVAYFVDNTVVTTTSGAPDGEHAGKIS